MAVNCVTELLQHRKGAALTAAAMLSKNQAQEARSPWLNENQKHSLFHRKVEESGDGPSSKYVTRRIMFLEEVSLRYD